MNISFENKHPFLDVPIDHKTSSWLINTVHKEDFHLGKLHYTFLNDADLHQMNVKFLQHDTYTDIITFDYNQQSFVIGEIYISLDRVKENAQNTNVDFIHELHRVLIHGLLHLMGYQDKSLKEKSIMTSKEDYYLSLLPRK